MANRTDDLASDAGNSPGATQDDHIIAIETELGKDALLLTSLDGIEAMSRSFVYTVEVLTRQSDERVRTLLGKPVTIWLQNDNEATRRPLHGHARHLRRLELNSRGYRRWRMELCPWLWFLTKSIDCRIYHHLSVPDILRSVFSDHELVHHQFRLLEQYPNFDFCVQYRESAFDFVSRLMEHVGIAYWFEHHEDRHVLVIADSNQMAPFTQPRQASQSMRADLGDIQELTQDFAIRTGASALNDYDFEVPTKTLRTHEASILGAHPLSRFEIYDYPGHFTNADEGKRLTRLRMEEEEARHIEISGLGSAVAFQPGHRFELTPDLAMGNEKPVLYLLTEVRHRARDSRYYTDASEPPSYSNRFVCIPAETPFRPERLTSKPVVQGPQTATVVGPSGENIHTDQYGRVRVLFHWDRRGEHNERASCWLRVSQASAGSHWGGISIPHVGQEVIVEFLEGDPDRPVVTGRLHNGTNKPPLDLPRDRNKTILRDHGDNKLIMQGQAGRQWMTMVSPRALNFIAARPAAKPLSASVDYQNNTAPDFDNGLESDAFLEMQGIYAELTGQRAPTQPNPARFSYGKITTTSQSDDTELGDYTASPADINTLSEGRINSLSLGNVNAWVGGHFKQEIIQETYQKFHGSVTNIYKSPIENTVETIQNDMYAIMHSEENVGLHFEVTTAHIEDTILHFEMHSGVHWTLDIGPTIQLNEAVVLNRHLVAVRDVGADLDKVTTRVTDAEAVIKTITSEIANHVTKTEMTQAMHSVTAGVFSLNCLGMLSMSATTMNITAKVIIVMSAPLGVHIN